MTTDEGSKVENLDLRFALVDSEGVERYPYRIKKKDGRFGFVLGTDRFNQAEVVPTIEEVVRGVVNDEKPVRTSDYPPTKAKGSSSLSLAAGREIQGYRIAPSLAYLVAEAKIRPLGAPEGKGVASTSAASPHSATTWLSRLAGFSSGELLQALTKVEQRMTDEQRAMLRGHANAPAQELAMQQIAELGGYDDYSVANSQYGRLGRLFAEQLGIDADQLTNRVQAICEEAGRNDAQGHFVWRLRPQLLDALLNAGWVEPLPASTDDPALAGAAAEVEADEQCRNIPETTRKALVNARIGQGGYRLRMFKVWGGRCAVTGLGIPEALVASHAMAWRDSNNHQRLDEYNGLLLSATIDRLFDKGLISFSDAGEFLVQPGLSRDELRAGGLTPESRLRATPDRCRPYLKAHRERFGFEE